MLRTPAATSGAPCTSTESAAPAPRCLRGVLSGAPPSVPGGIQYGRHLRSLDRHPTKDERSITRRLIENTSQLLGSPSTRVALERLPPDLRLIGQTVLEPALPERAQRLLDRYLVTRIGDDARAPLSHESTCEVVRAGERQNWPARGQVFEELPRRREAG